VLEEDLRKAKLESSENQNARQQLEMVNQCLSNCSKSCELIVVEINAMVFCSFNALFWHMQELKELKALEQQMKPKVRLFLAFNCTIIAVKVCFLILPRHETPFSIHVNMLFKL
jgi:hypothetical protein